MPSAAFARIWGLARKPELKLEKLKEVVADVAQVAQVKLVESPIVKPVLRPKMVDTGVDAFEEVAVDNEPVFQENPVYEKPTPQAQRPDRFLLIILSVFVGLFFFVALFASWRASALQAAHSRMLFQLVSIAAKNIRGAATSVQMQTPSASDALEKLLAEFS